MLRAGHVGGEGRIPDVGAGGWENSKDVHNSGHLSIYRKIITDNRRG